MIQIQKVNFKGYTNSWQVSNGDIEVVVTGDIGPRIMRYGFPGGQNFFKVFEEQMGKTGEPAWQPRGGHRVWIAPEDNQPVTARVVGGAGGPANRRFAVGCHARRRRDQ